MGVKRKILIVNDLLYGGGVEKLMYDLVMYWHEKYDITIMTYAYCEGFEDMYPSDVKYISASVKKEYNGNIIERVYNKFKKKIFGKWFCRTFSKEKFDIIIAIKDGWILQKVAAMSNAPVKLGWIHTDYNSYYYTYDIFEGPQNELNCMKTFDKIVCVSETIKKGIIDVIGDPGNLVVKYNPIDVNNIIEKSKEAVVDVDPTEEGVTRFVTVGRLNHQKGFDLLLEACHMLEREGYKFEVLIIGDKEPWSDEHNRLYRAQKRLNLHSVKFLGGRKNPYKYMKCGDWFISSSIFEGFSLVSQEAAVLDIPEILTNCSGVRELIGDSEYGIVAEISVLGLYNAMKDVLENPQLHAHYKNKIMQRKDIIKFEERIEDIEELFK